MDWLCSCLICPPFGRSRPGGCSASHVAAARSPCSSCCWSSAPAQARPVGPWQGDHSTPGVGAWQLGFTTCVLRNISLALLGKPPKVGWSWCSLWNMAMFGHSSLWTNPTGWLCNNHLETYEFVNAKDDIPYIMENKHVWNHQQISEVPDLGV